LVLIAFGLGAGVGSSNVGLTDPVSGFTSLQVVQDDSSNLGTFHAYKTISSVGTQSATFNWTDTESGQISAAAIATYKGSNAATTIAPTASFGAATTVVYSASGGTTVAPTYPASITSESGLILIVGQKPATADGGTCSTPSGWTLLGSITAAGGYGATLGADTGDTNLYVYTKNVVLGTESGSLTVTVGDNNVCWATIIRVDSNLADGIWYYAMASGSDTSAGNVSITMGSDPGVIANDLVIGAMCIPTDVSTPTQFSAEAFTQTGVTFGTVTEIEEPDSTTGNDIGGFLCYAPVTAGPSSAAPVMTATAGGTTTNVRGPGVFIRARTQFGVRGPWTWASQNTLLRM
jgi:hypothetical protein